MQLVIIAHDNTGYAKVSVNGRIYEYYQDAATVYCAVCLARYNPGKALNLLKKGERK